VAGVIAAQPGEDLRVQPGDQLGDVGWGYVLSGKVTMRYTDGPTETLSAGQAYYIRPGHNAHGDEDVALVEFTPADHTPGINTLES
jgi:quercetin dioxygenase-like cupin family protein